MIARKTLVVALMLFCCAVCSFAQNPTPTPIPAATDPCSSSAINAGTAPANCGVHFITGSAFYQLSNGKQATEFDARLPVAPHWSGFAAVFAVPGAQGNITVGGVEYRERLSKVFKTAASSKAGINLSKIEAFGRVGLGSEANSVNNQRSFAYLTEGGVEFPVATMSGGPVVKAGVRIGFLGVAHYGAAPEHFFLGSNTAISPQVSISF